MEILRGLRGKRDVISTFPTISRSPDFRRSLFVHVSTCPLVHLFNPLSLLQARAQPPCSIQNQEEADQCRAPPTTSSSPCWPASSSSYSSIPNQRVPSPHLPVSVPTHLHCHTHCLPTLYITHIHTASRYHCCIRAVFLLISPGL